jgi:S-DNA-T family DNA segregation ATPase FtsK/SpoIIIE
LSHAPLTERPSAQQAAEVAAQQLGKRHEVLGLLTLASTVLLTLALVSYDTRGGRDWCGPIGAAVAESLIAMMGTAALVLPAAMLLQSLRFFTRNRTSFTALKILGTLVILASLATAGHLWLGERPLLGHLAAGGLIGISLGETLRSLIGTAGAQIVVLTSLLVALVVRTRLSVVAFARSAQTAGVKTGHLAASGVATVAKAWQQVREDERASAGAAAGVALEQIADVEAQTESALAEVLASHRELDGEAFYSENAEIQPRLGSDAFSAEALLSTASAPPHTKQPLSVAKADVSASSQTSLNAVPSQVVRPMVSAHQAAASVHSREPIVSGPAAPHVSMSGAAQVQTAQSSRAMPVVAPDDEPVALSKRKSAVRKRAQPLEPAISLAPLAASAAPLGADAEPAKTDLVSKMAAEINSSKPDVLLQTPAGPSSSDPSRAGPDSAPEPLPIVRHDDEIAAALETPPEPASAAPVRAKHLLEQEFEFPSASVLTPAPRDGFVVDESQLRAAAERLLKTLKDYQIEGEIVEIHPGPVVTTYEFVPTAGTKLARIAARSDDIAMSLAVNKVRIVAPIPGKGRVGFEIPNSQRKTVYLRELIDAEAFNRIGGALPVALGKDVVGAPFFSDLAAMPHLIVAGATGQGKSVGLNVMLCSLLYKRTPDEVRMLMIDPKMVELAVYDGIPHMLLPVVTDMKKAALALRWVVDEMERRYSLFAQTGSRNITTFNERVVRALQDGVQMKGFAGAVRTKQTGTTVDVSKSGELSEESVNTPCKLPYIVVVVDEFADLMMVAGKEVEAAVARLAQKARAAGIHVILATQRPSVDVITGMIKANFPSRVAFKVSQKVDSRTILDQQGAENLLGRGDMLILPPGSSDLRRVHCAFVSEDEVQAITDHWRKQGTPTYDEEILKPREEETESETDEPEIRVPLEKYEKAVALVLSSRRCSVSWIQRQLAIGYNVAARMVERMEREGLVSSPRGPGKDREILR